MYDKLENVLLWRVSSVKYFIGFAFWRCCDNATINDGIDDRRRQGR